MTRVVAPRARALVTSVRTSRDPTPWPCHSSATTTPMSAASVPPGPVSYAAMACPMMTPPRVATTASAAGPSPARVRSMAGLVSGAPVKNRR
jgi:hypothetical protein